MVKSPFSNSSVPLCPLLVLEMRVCSSLSFRYKTSSLLKSQIYLAFKSQRVFLLSVLSFPIPTAIPWRRGRLPTPVFLGFPGGSAGKESTCKAGDLGSIPGLGRSPGEGKGYPLQYSGLENSMDCAVHVVAKSRKQASDFHFHFSLPLS